ncbi:MAG: hypothetical protein GF383_01735 [Candidatus Lokiarchaeota archaeon]|nr:hypothetical protein [Candidatus Lokiarchaeota archaeon]MBD3338028.1 hypothetical protein [Candidatus Lokiarchaeota archaeon]
MCGSNFLNGFSSQDFGHILERLDAIELLTNFETWEEERAFDTIKKSYDRLKTIYELLNAYNSDLTGELRNLIELLFLSWWRCEICQTQSTLKIFTQSEGERLFFLKFFKKLEFINTKIDDYLSKTCL